MAGTNDEEEVEAKIPITLATDQNQWKKWTLQRVIISNWFSILSVLKCIEKVENRYPTYKLTSSLHVIPVFFLFIKLALYE